MSVATPFFLRYAWTLNRFKPCIAIETEYSLGAEEGNCGFGYIWLHQVTTASSFLYAGPSSWCSPSKETIKVLELIQDLHKEADNARSVYSRLLQLLSEIFFMERFLSQNLPWLPLRKLPPSKIDSPEE